MYVNHDLDASSMSPVKRLSENFIGALNVGIPGQRAYGPVSDRNSYEVQPIGGNLAEIVLCDPSVPVRFETIKSFSLSEGLA